MRPGDPVIIKVGWPRHPVVGRFVRRDDRGRYLVEHHGWLYRRRRAFFPWVG